MADVQAKVTLVRATPEPDQLIAAAGRLCYASDTEKLLAEQDADPGKFIGKLIEMGHLSTIEHASFTFYIEGVSRAMTHQLVRHRLASYSQRSQRYVSHDTFDYVIPPQLEGKTVEIDGKEIDAVEFFHETMRLIAKRYGQLIDALGRQGEKSNEDARYILPNACETKIFVTMNARELLHFLEERLCYRAQWEIRGVAEKMLTIIKDLCPAVFGKVGPKCIRLGHCPEGARSCGRFAEVKKKYL